MKDTPALLQPSNINAALPALGFVVHEGRMPVEGHSDPRWSGAVRIIGSTVCAVYDDGRPIARGELLSINRYGLYRCHNVSPLLGFALDECGRLSNSDEYFRMAELARKHEAMTLYAGQLEARVRELREQVRKLKRLAAATKRAASRRLRAKKARRK